MGFEVVLDLHCLREWRWTVAPLFLEEVVEEAQDAQAVCPVMSRERPKGLEGEFSPVWETGYLVKDVSRAPMVAWGHGVRSGRDWARYPEGAGWNRLRYQVR